MSTERLPIAAIAGLGLTQNIGYGTLYYSFSILAPSMARDFSVSNEWIFGTLSVALLAGGFLAPWLGKWIDRYGAGRMMTIGSILAAVSLILCSFSPNALVFAGALTIIEIAANLVQYGAAFALLVQLAPNVAQSSITYLTLFAGFASTIFWPITTTLQHWLTWQQTYLLFACLHLFLCVPIHLMLARLIAKSGRKPSTNGIVATASVGGLPAHQRRKGFVLVLVAFSTQALVAAARRRDSHRIEVVSLISAYRQTWLERNHGSKAHFAHPGRIKKIDTITIETQAKQQTVHFNPSRDFLLCSHRLLLPVCRACNSFIAVT